jgi:hypothetical protein
VRIYHTETDRAALTATLLRAELESAGFTIPNPASLVLQYEEPAHDILAKITRRLSETAPPGAFGVMVCHEPNFDKFFHDKDCQPGNNTFVTHDLLIAGEVWTPS